MRHRHVSREFQPSVGTDRNQTESHRDIYHVYIAVSVQDLALTIVQQKKLKKAVNNYRQKKKKYGALEATEDAR